MGIILAIGFLAVAAILWWAVRAGRLNNAQIETLARIMSILAALAAVATFLLSFPNLSPGPSTASTPEFTFHFGGTADSNRPAYEVTEELANPGGKVGNFQIVVSAKYDGHDYAGPMYVRIIQADNTIVEAAQWKDFRASSRESQTIKLTPSQLFAYSGMPSAQPGANPLQKNLEGLIKTFDIEVSFNKTQQLAKRTVQVIYTPWYHTTTLSDAAIGAGQTITAYVTTRNLGAPARFQVYGNLYESTGNDPKTLYIGDEGWWAGKTWNELDFGPDIVTEKPVGTNEEFTAAFPIPGTLFKARRTYILETYATKQLPFLDFAPSDWLKSDDRWRGRDQPHFSTIVVLAP